MESRASDIETIVFDMGGVILKSNKLAVIEQLARDAGKSLELTQERFQSAQAQEIMCQWEMGSVDDAFAIHSLASQIEVEETDFRRALSNLFSLNEEIVPLVESWASKYRIVLASNSPHFVAQYVRREFEIFDLFDAFVFSYDIGARKPALEFLEHLATTVGGVASDRTLFVDDNAKNISAARSVGFAALQYRNTVSLQLEFGSIGS